MLTTSLIKKSVALLTTVAALGCSAAGDDSGHSQEPVDTTAATAGWQGGWRYHNVPFNCAEDKIVSSVSRRSRRHVYKFPGEAGNSVTLNLEAEWPASYGAMVIVTDAYGELVGYDYKTYGNALEVEAEFTYTENHYVFVAPAKSYRVRTWHDYTLTADCGGVGCADNNDCAAGEECVQVQCVTTPCPALCQPAPLCAEYTTNNGTYAAKNFEPGHFAEAEAWVDVLDRSTSGVNIGTCADLNTKICPETDEEVCGQPEWASYPKTYASLCDFQKFLRGHAGDDGEASGTWTKWSCEQCDHDADPNKRYIGTDTEMCTRITYICEEGEQPFSDDCGCGCEAKCDHDADPNKHYVGTSPQMCQTIKFACQANQTFFSDECGCGCLDQNPPN